MFKRRATRLGIFAGITMTSLIQPIAGIAQYVDSVPPILIGNWYPAYPASMKCGDFQTIVHGFNISQSGDFSLLTGHTRCNMTDFKYFDPRFLGPTYLGDWTYKISCKKKDFNNSPGLIETIKYGRMKLEVSKGNKLLLHIDQSDNQSSFTEAPKNLTFMILQRCE